MQKLSGPMARLHLIMPFFCLALLIPAAQAQAQQRPSLRKPTGRFLAIPAGTEIKIRLHDDISTKQSKDGDKFTATALSPDKYADAKIEGHILRVHQSGKLRGKTILTLSFDRIRLKNGRSGRIAAHVVRVYDADSVKKVDEEGNIESDDKAKTTGILAGGGAALGAIVGAVASGAKGAAIGVLAGGGAGAASTVIKGSNKVKLERGTEILIRTSGVGARTIAKK